MRRTHLFVWQLGVLAFLLGAASSPARAQDVHVTVVAIHATDRNKDVDEDLKAIAEKVQKKEPRLTGFRKGRTTVMKVTVGKEKTFPLVDSEVVAVTVDSLLDKDKVQLTIRPPMLMSITYSTPYEKFFPIVTGYESKDKDRLIVAIMVESEKGK